MSVSAVVDWRADLGADLRHVTVLHRRALWAIVVLNLTMGFLGFVSGVLAESQALMAAALAFLSVGSLTFFGLVAIGRPASWRTGVALLQGGLFVVMGAWVLLSTAYRVVVVSSPEVGVMGSFAVLAVAADVASAALLLPHRGGDASLRAIWLSGRNAALGNVSVLIAAAFVILTATRWPDLIAAALIAGLFLRSSYAIIRDASNERTEGGARGPGGQ